MHAPPAAGLSPLHAHQPSARGLPGLQAAGCCPVLPTRQLRDCGEGAGSLSCPPAASPPALALAEGQHPGQMPAQMTPARQMGG